MYVIEDKKGKFWSKKLNWTRNINDAEIWGTKTFALLACEKGGGERVFEVHLVLGKQVK